MTYNITAAAGGFILYDISSTDTTIALQGGNGNGLPETNGLMDLSDGINRERIFYATRSGDVLSGVIRGVDALIDLMPAQEWVAGTSCRQNITATFLRSMIQGSASDNEMRLSLCPIGTEIRYIPALYGDMTFADWLTAHPEWEDLAVYDTQMIGRVSGVAGGTHAALSHVGTEIIPSITIDAPQVLVGVSTGRMIPNYAFVGTENYQPTKFFNYAVKTA